jgi:hypothetical protein
MEITNFYKENLIKLFFLPSQPAKMSEKEESISTVEKNILNAAIRKLNFVSRNGSGDSLTEEETIVFNYWLKKGRIRAVENSRFGEIYELFGS